MENWESEIWEAYPPEGDEPAILESQLPGLVSHDGTRRHCTDYPSIKDVAKFYATISQKPVDVHRDETGWWCLRIEMPPLTAERLIAAEHERLNAERAERARQRNELAKLPSEKDLPGKFSADKSLFKCETRETAELSAKYFELKSRKSVHIWSDPGGWAVETHEISPLEQSAKRAREALEEEKRIWSGDLTNEEWSEREAQREQERINEQWRQDRPSPSWSSLGTRVK